MTRRSSAALPGLDDPASEKLGGPVYQGVCEAIRALFARPAGHRARCKCEACADVAERKARAAGTIAQARSVAGSLDRCSGHNGTRQASGVQLAAMHDQLDKLLERLSPADGDGDDFDQFLEEMRQAREEAIRGSATEAPHAAQ